MQRLRSSQQLIRLLVQFTARPTTAAAHQLLDGRLDARPLISLRDFHVLPTGQGTHTLCVQSKPSLGQGAGLIGRPNARTGKQQFSTAEQRLRRARERRERREEALDSVPLPRPVPQAVDCQETLPTLEPEEGTEFFWKS